MRWPMPRIELPTRQVSPLIGKQVTTESGQGTYGARDFLPVVAERRPSLAAAILVTIVVPAALRAHVVERP